MENLDLKEFSVIGNFIGLFNIKKSGFSECLILLLKCIK